MSDITKVPTTMANPSRSQYEESDHIDDKALNVIRSVLEGCKKESIENILFTDISNYIERTSYYTGMTEKAITELESEFDYSPPLELTDKLIINNILKTMYSELKEITYECLFEDFKSQKKDAIDFETFTKAMKKSGYRKVGVKDGITIIIEDPKLTFERFLYLQKITKARKRGTCIYYIDIKCYSEHEKIMVPFKGSLHNIKSPSPSDKLLFYYIVSEEGFHNGLMTNSPTFDSYIKWLMHAVVPHLKPSSTIVVNNNYTMTQNEPKLITRLDSKKTMINRLRQNKIPCHPHMHKAELFELIEKSLFKPECRSLNNVIATHGHQVICIPEHIHEILPMNQAWKVLNQDILKCNENRELLRESLNLNLQKRLKDIGAIWKNYEARTVSLESKFLNLDTAIEDILDNVTFKDRFS